MSINPRKIVNLPPGVNKNDNPYTSMIWSDADKVRFYKGFPQKIGGWSEIVYENDIPLQGSVRSLFNFIDKDGREHLLIGSSWGLYDYIDSTLYNITPIELASDVTPASIANSISTNYGLVGNNPLSITSGDTEVTLNVSPFNINIFRGGDQISITGATAVGNIPAVELNDIHIINSVDTSNNTISFSVLTEATSTTTGGGAAVNLATKYLTIVVANSYKNYWRIKINNSTDVGGILAANINKEFTIFARTPTQYTIYINSGGFATSSVTGGSGISTTVQKQIPAGAEEYSVQDGYGGGLYGLGIYGEGSPFDNGVIYPTVWSFGNFPFNRAANPLVDPPDYIPGVALTQGYNALITSGTYPYIWDGNLEIAPTVSLQAEGQILINFLFTSHGQVVTYGADGNENRIKTCSNGDFNQWKVPAVEASSSAYDTIIATAGRFIGRSSVRDRDILFTQNGTYEFIYVGVPQIWITREITLADGIIAPFATASINDYCFWMGQNDFYVYNGATFSDIPNNTLKQWVFENLNRGRGYHSFCFLNLQYNEIWFFFPTSDDQIEPNAYAIYNYSEGHWTNGYMTRTAAELPLNEIHYNYLANTSASDPSINALYEHEVEYGNGSPDIPFETRLETSYALLGEGENIQYIDRVIPSSRKDYSDDPTDITTPIYQLTMYTKEYDGDSVEKTYGPYNVALATNKIDIRGTGRQRKYVFTSNTADSFRIEKWYEEIKETTRR